MSQIKNDKDIKVGLSGLIGTRTAPQAKEQTPEEILDSMSPETREALIQEKQRRQYLKAGRPPKGESKEKKYIRKTLLVSPEKYETLIEIALREKLFLKELVDHALDVVIAEHENK